MNQEVAMQVNAVVTTPDIGVVALAPASMAINRVFLLDFLRKQAGKFVSVDFVKLDGSPRRLNGRLGVISELKGGSNTVMKPDRPYLTMFDAKQMGYRTVNLSTVSKVRAEGTEFCVV